MLTDLYLKWPIYNEAANRNSLSLSQASDERQELVLEYCRSCSFLNRASHEMIFE